MLVLVIALGVVSVMMVVLACATLDGLVNSATVPCVQIIAPPMGSVMMLLQYVLVHLVILVGDASTVLLNRH
jgi:hypothetical protein